MARFKPIHKGLKLLPVDFEVAPFVVRSMVTRERAYVVSGLSCWRWVPHLLRIAASSNRVRAGF